MAEEKRTVLPEFPLPDGYADAGEFLRNLVRERIAAWVKAGSIGVGDREARLNKELDVLCLGFPEQILIVRDYIRAARRAGFDVNADIGAACASEVLYALDVISVDPLEKGLRFELFVNPKFAKEWVPSIAVRTSAEGRKFIITYLAEKYGKDRVARVRGDDVSLVMSGRKLSDVIAVKVEEGGLLETDCPMRDILRSDSICLYTVDASPVHPIEVECLRETNGLMVYKEQLADMLNLMSGLSYEWSLWAQKCLSTKRMDSCGRYKGEFVSACLANADFRIGRWMDEAFARAYLDRRWESWYKYGNRLVMRTHIVSGDHVVRHVTHRKTVGEVGFQDIELALRNGDRVAVVVRHAERPPLEKDDPTFGAELPITREGKIKADAFGFALKEFSGGFEHGIQSSKTTRCRMTAQVISEAMGGELAGSFRLDDILGDKSPFFGNVDERLALANEGNYRESLNEYFRTGRQRGFADLASATEAFEDYLWSRSARHFSPLEIYVTHDINVGCFLGGRRVVTRFDDFNWPHYLDAAVAFLGKNGRARYGYLRSWESKNTFDC